MKYNYQLMKIQKKIYICYRMMNLPQNYQQTNGSPDEINILLSKAYFNGNYFCWRGCKYHENLKFSYDLENI